MISYNELKEKAKEFLAATGIRVDEFERLLPAFASQYESRYPADKTMKGQPRQRQPGGGVKGVLAKLEDKLLFILIYEKSYPIQTMQGLHFGLSQSQVNEWVHRLMPLLRQALAELGMTPVRDPQAVATDPLVNEGGSDLVIDGTERRRQRPKDAQQQRESYSGKKKSPTEVGKTHDKKMVDQQSLACPSGATLAKDTGFQGYEPEGVVTYQPKKSQKAKT